jgi:hypothetical protein
MTISLERRLIATHVLLVTLLAKRLAGNAPAL